LTYLAVAKGNTKRVFENFVYTFVPRFGIIVELKRLERKNRKGGGAVKQILLEEEVMQTDRERVQALLGNDALALVRIYGDELIFINQYGVVRDNAHWIATAREREFKVDSCTTEDVRVRIKGGRRLSRVASWRLVMPEEANSRNCR
jgi:hypothetical protein